MNARKKLWKVFSLTMVVVFALAFAAREATWVQAHDDDDDEDPPRMVSFPQIAHGLFVGEKIRTILFNRGTRPITVQVSVLDANGAVVKQEALVVAPGRMDTSEVNCAEAACPVPGPVPDGPVLLSVTDPRSKLLRTEVRLRLADVPNLLITSAVVADSTGSTNGGAPERLAANHNETLVRDTAR